MRYIRLTNRTLRIVPDPEAQYQVESETIHPSPTLNPAPGHTQVLTLSPEGTWPVAMAVWPASLEDDE